MIPFLTRNIKKIFRLMITVNNCRFCKLFYFFFIICCCFKLCYCSNAETGYLLNQQQSLTLRKNTQNKTKSRSNANASSFKTNPNENFKRLSSIDSDDKIDSFLGAVIISNSNEFSNYCAPNKRSYIQFIQCCCCFVACKNLIYFIFILPSR